MRCTEVGAHEFLAARGGSERRFSWEIDLDAGTWIVPGEKTNGTLKAKRTSQVPNHIIPLPRQAVEILKPL